GETPDIAVRITNRTGREIHLLPCLDGSDFRWRYPLCYFEVIGPDGKPAAKEPPRCGDLDALGADLFVPVRAGGSFDPFARVATMQPPVPFQLAAETFGWEGEYLIRFVYSTAEPKLRPWLGDLSAEEGAKLSGLLGRIPKTTVTSNEIRIEVRG